MGFYPLSTKIKNIRRPIPDEGRKVLYRLLLVAVAVVYALVFVLDYLLQLHFTFFLLLSLFGFVILTLFYMWFRVSGTQEIIEEEQEEIAEEEKIIQPVFEDPVFYISVSTGLILDCSDEALRLFETEDKNASPIVLNFTIKQVFWKSWIFILFVGGLLIFLIIFYYRYQIRKINYTKQLEIDTIRLEKESNSSKLKAFKSQMNPHFFYNALNTLQSYILTNEKKPALTSPGSNGSEQI